LRRTRSVQPGDRLDASSRVSPIARLAGSPWTWPILAVSLCVTSFLAKHRDAPIAFCAEPCPPAPTPPRSLRRRRIEDVVVPPWYRMHPPMRPIRHSAGTRGTAGTGNGRIYTCRPRFKSGRPDCVTTAPGAASSLLGGRSAGSVVRNRAARQPISQAANAGGRPGERFEDLGQPIDAPVDPLAAEAAGVARPIRVRRASKGRSPWQRCCPASPRSRPA
jgi:hypothetical protein